MARRRINTRFLIVTASIAGLSAGVAVLLYKSHKPRNPQPYIQAGDLSFAKQDYGKAIQNYSYASDLLPEDPSLHIKLGKAYFQTRSQNADNFQLSVTQFTKAEELKPDSKEAWEGLFEVNEMRVESWENRPGDPRDREALPTFIAMAREAAEHLVKLEPGSVDAASAEPILIIRTWLLNLTIPESYAERDLPPDKQPTPEQRAEQAIVDLTKVMHDHPENEKIPYWIARAKIYQAQQAIKNEQPSDAVPLFAEASNQFEESIDKRPDVMGLHLNKASILVLLQSADPDPAHWQEYRQRAHDALDKAQALADPKNAMAYEMAKQQWALNLSTTDPAEAEDVWKDLIKRYPDELLFRLQLARLLQAQPSRRDDAIALLNDIAKLPAPSITNVALRQPWDQNTAVAKLTKADIETDQLPTTPPGKARVALVNDIQSSIDAARNRLGDSWSLLRVQGRFQLNNGQVRDSIQTLTQAADKMQVEIGTISSKLLHDEAEAYRQGGQTGKAIELLEKVAADPTSANDADLQKTLADLNIANKDYAKAKPYIDWLSARFPTDPRIIALRIEGMGPDADPEVIKPLFKSLPESTPEDIANKYSFALQTGNVDEQVRLLTLIHKNKPDDTNIAVSLIQLLVSANHPDQANQILADELKAHPGDPTLLVFQKAMGHASQNDIDTSELSVINAVPDPFLREGKLVEYYRAKQNPDGVLAHLKKQLEVQPDNTVVLQEVFFWYMDAKRFSDAEAMIPHLVQLDADNAHGLMFETKLSLAKQDIPNALVFSRQMTHDLPNFAPSFELYGESLRASGQLELACEQFVSALSLQATNIEASKNLIQCSVQQGKLDEARGYITDACKRFPNDPAYRDMRIGFETMYGNPESVLPELSGILQKYPDNQRNYTMYGDALLASMRAKSRQGDSDAANQYLSQARDVIQKALAHWPDSLRFASDLAQIYQQTGDLTNAAVPLKTISERPRWKDQPAPLILLGRVYLAGRKLPEAYDVLHQAHEADPRSIDACMTLCDCLIIQGKYEDALAVLQPAAADFRIRSKYCDLLVGMGRGAQAEVSLQDAIKASPTNMALTNLMLHVYDAEGKYDRGIQASSDAIANDPRNIFAYFYRGKMEASGPNPDLDSAQKDLSFFRDSVPTSVDGRVILSEVLDARKDRDGSIHELEDAMGFDQENRQVRLLLLRDYLGSNPPRTIDADRLLSQTLAIPVFEHDPDFETQAALLWAKKGENDKALATIQDAMQHTTDKLPKMHDYFTVLLTMGAKDPKYLQLLLDESQAYVSDPKTSWMIFSDRGCAKAGLGDKDGATPEFATAMDRAGTEPGTSPSETAATVTAQRLGVDKALELVLPRAQNSVTWKLIAVDLLIEKGDLSKGMAMAESALPAADTLSRVDQYHLYQSTSSLYLNSTPPMVDKATPIFQKILAMQPDDELALNDMACILVDMTTPPKLADALSYSQHAYDLSVKSGRIDPRVYDTQGWVLLRNGRIDDAIEVMHRSIDQADFPEAHYHLGQAYLQKQMPDEAQHELASASDMVQAKKSDSHEIVDQTLKEKIDASLKQADDMIRAKSADKTAF